MTDHTPIEGFIKVKNISVNLGDFKSMQDAIDSVKEQVLSYAKSGNRGNAQRGFVNRAFNNNNIRSWVVKNIKKEAFREEALEWENNKKEALADFLSRDIVTPYKLTQSPYGLTKDEAKKVFEKVTGQSDRISLGELRDKVRALYGGDVAPSFNPKTREEIFNES